MYNSTCASCMSTFRQQILQRAVADKVTILITIMSSRGTSGTRSRPRLLS